MTGLLSPNHLLQQRYRIIRRVGQGGMGAVYMAADTHLDDRLVAVKEMSQSGQSPQKVIQTAAAFKHEAHILAELRHPNLPRIYDYFSDAGRWYLVMDFIKGETLEDYLENAGGRLPVGEVLTIGIQLATVLGYLHSQQPPIIFRDLKPANVMRTPDGDLFLIDFGIARLFKSGQAKDTIAYGTAGYAAPEQYGRAQTTPQSDIYSLGALLHQLLSGHDPSDNTPPYTFPPLTKVPTELEKLIGQMVQMDVMNRPASMAAIKQELQRIASPVPPAAPPILPGPMIQPSPSPSPLPLPSPNAAQAKTPQKIARALIALVILFIGLSAGWIFGIRPVLHGIAQRELDTAMANAASGIPRQPKFSGSITVSVKEDIITTLIASKLAPSSPVQNPVAHITPNNVRLDFQLYGFPCAISLVPQVDNARLVVSNVKVEGIASLVMSPDEMTALLNKYLQQYLQYSVTTVQLTDHEMDLTVSLLC